MDIKKITKDDRPRERLINEGASKLLDYELLAIMLGSGTKEKSVLDLSIELIDKYGFLKLFQMDFNELKKINGIKSAKASKLMACFEIAKRCQIKMNEINKLELDNSELVYNYIKSHFLCDKHEKLFIIYTDVKCRIIKYDIFTNDENAEIAIPIKRIIKSALENNAFGIFISHNHPSGDVTPSRSDIISTKALLNALKPLGIYLFDHLVISDLNYYSFSDNKLI